MRARTRKNKKKKKKTLNHVTWDLVYYLARRSRCIMWIWSGGIKVFDTSSSLLRLDCHFACIRCFGHSCPDQKGTSNEWFKSFVVDINTDKVAWTQACPYFSHGSLIGWPFAEFELEKKNKNKNSSKLDVKDVALITIVCPAIVTAKSQLPCQQQKYKTAPATQGCRHGKGDHWWWQWHRRESCNSRRVSLHPSNRLVSLHPQDNRVWPPSWTRRFSRSTGRCKLPGCCRNYRLVLVHQDQNWLRSAYRTFWVVGSCRRSVIPVIACHFSRLWIAILWEGFHSRASSKWSVLWLRTPSRGWRG